MAKAYVQLRWPKEVQRGVSLAKQRGGMHKDAAGTCREENRCKLWWANARQAESHLDKQLTQGIQTSLRPFLKHI